MLTGIDIVDLKRKYGTIGMISIGEDKFYYRLLTAIELNIIQTSKSIDESDIEEAICNWTLLDPLPPIDWEKYGPFFCTNLAENIIQESGYKDQEDIVKQIEQRKASIGADFAFQIIVGLCQTFPSYNPMTLRTLTIEQLLDELALAELVSGKSLIRRKKVIPSRSGREGPSVPMTQGQQRGMEESEDALSEAMNQKVSSKIPSTGFPVYEEETELYEQLRTTVDTNKSRLEQLRDEGKRQ